MRALAVGIIMIVLLGLAALAWKVCFVAKPTAVPALSKQWHEQVYGLDADEVARFVPPPYSPERMKDFGRGWAGAPPKSQLGQLAYHVLPTRTQHWGMSSGVGNLYSGLSWSTGMTSPELDVPGELGQLAADGDWIARWDASMDRRMKALESILSHITGKALAFEKKMVERDVIVARGTWAFHEDEQYAALASAAKIGKPQSGAVHFYTVPLSPILGGGGGTGRLTDLLKMLEESSRRKFVDEIQEPRPNSIQWRNHHSQYAARESEEKLDQLLANVQRQTSIQFSKEKRPMPVWFVREKSSATRPGAER